MTVSHAPVWNGLEDLRPVLALRLRGRCRDESELDDLIQETFLRAARYRSSLGDSSKLTGWLVRIARNVQHDDFVRCARGPRSDGADEVLEQAPGRELAPGEGPDEVHVRVAGELVERSHLLRHLCAALGELGAQDLLVLDEHYRRREGSAAIAARLGVTQTMVKVRLYRARRRLGRRMRSALALECGRSGAAGGVRA